MIRKLIEEIIEKYYREIDEYYSRYREDEDGFSSCAYNNDFLAIAWIEADVWEYINSENISTCELYQCGYNRVGCIGCTMAGKNRYKEFADFPKYKNLYIHAFDRMLEVRKAKGKPVQWTCGEEVYHWWMQDTNVFGQMQLSDFMEMKNEY